MVEQVRVSIIYYSATGTVHALANAAAEGAEKAGAEVRLRKVPELAPPQAIASNPAWQAHAEATADVVEATLDDLDWADVVLLGTPTRYGTPASQLKQFIDTTGPIWVQGRLAGKVYGAFTSAAHTHGGIESTLLALSNVFYHWGGVIVPPGFTDAVKFQHGNPYGSSHVAAGDPPGETELEAARYQARRAVEIAEALKAGQSLLSGAA